MARKFELYTYDTWGNADDGYEVNDVSRIATIELDSSDGEFGCDPVAVFIEQGDLKPDIRETCDFVDYPGVGLGFEIESKADGKPLGRIEEVL